MNKVFKKDLYRYYGEGGEPFLKKVFRPLELRFSKQMQIQAAEAFLYVKTDAFIP